MGKRIHMQNTNGIQPIKRMGRRALCLACLLPVIILCSLLKERPGAAQVLPRSWNRVGSPEAGRFLHTATLLQNGKVLVAGGLGAGASGTIPLNSAELYDPATGTWSRTGSLSTTRFYHTAVLLTNGKVLVSGGGSRLVNNVFVSQPIDAVESYDPSSRTWSVVRSLSLPRREHTATLLSNGKVLLAGGGDSRGLATNTAEVYDPGVAGAGGSRTANDLSLPSRLHTAQTHAQDLTLELPVRTIAPNRNADVRKPQPAPRERRKQ